MGHTLLRGPGHGPALHLLHSLRRGRNQLASPLANAYLRATFKVFEFCIPTKATIVPDGPDWLHEIKFDGYRLRLERDGEPALQGLLGGAGL